MLFFSHSRNALSPPTIRISTFARGRRPAGAEIVPQLLHQRLRDPLPRLVQSGFLLLQFGDEALCGVLRALVLNVAWPALPIAPLACEI